MPTPESALIVDDQLMIRNLYTQVLKSLGIPKIDTASYATEAYKKFLTDRHSFILLDLGLPGKSGVELLKDFRSVDSNANIVVLTANSNKDSVIQCIKHGAKGYLLKTEEVADVKLKLRKIFNKIDFCIFEAYG